MTDSCPLRLWSGLAAAACGHFGIFGHVPRYICWLRPLLCSHASDTHSRTSEWLHVAVRSEGEEVRDFSRPLREEAPGVFVSAGDSPAFVPGVFTQVRLILLLKV